MKIRPKFEKIVFVALIALAGSLTCLGQANADDSGFDQSIYSDPLAMNQPLRSFAGTPFVRQAYVMTPYGIMPATGQMPNVAPAAPDPAYVANAIMWRGTQPLGASYLPPMGIQYFQNQILLNRYEQYLNANGANAAN